jgi:hypothetical protein
MQQDEEFTQLSQKKTEMNVKARNGMKKFWLIVSLKKGRNEHERPQQDKEFMHDSQRKGRNEHESMQWDEEFTHVSQKKAEMNVKACNGIKIFRHGQTNGEQIRRRKKEAIEKIK